MKKKMITLAVAVLLALSMSGCWEQLHQVSAPIPTTEATPSSSLEPSAGYTPAPTGTTSHAMTTEPPLATVPPAPSGKPFVSFSVENAQGYNPVDGETYPPATVTVSVYGYEGCPYALVNGGAPFFTDEELNTNAAYETYPELDTLGRCGPCMANIGLELMPTEPRGDIGMVRPSGWHTVRYDDLVDGNYLYNRCHLIGHQLSGENANERNLVTGTRYLNTQGMLPYENKAADYVQKTGNHVLYRATPIFDGDNLVASGVLIEAQSLEDDGAGVQFCVFCYNVQPGVVIDYATGDSWRDPDYIAPTEAPSTGEVRYILNKRSRKFHSPTCSGAESIADHNKAETDKGRDALIQEGYEPCGICKP